MLHSYTIMQQNAWAERGFYTAQERRTGQVVYLIEEGVGGPTNLYLHPGLPPVQQALVEGDVRWLVGTLPEGESLEDLRNQGALTEQAILSALLSVVDGLTRLAALTPPVVPSYLDPACIKRDRLGRWVLDYLALAHAPEARMSPSLPLGVQPFGVLLFWLVTGQVARRTRVQVAKMQHGVPPALQFMVIKCLGRAYPSLAELRTDLERAGNEREFKTVVGLIAQQRERGTVTAVEPVRIRVAAVQPEANMELAPGPSRVESAWVDDPEVAASAPRKPLIEPGGSQQVRLHVPPGGPFIPLNDQPWALPPRPREGFRQYVVPPPPNPVRQRLVRWGSLGGVAVLAGVISLAVAVRLELIPPEFLPVDWRPVRAVSAYPGMARAGVQVGGTLPPDLPGPSAGGGVARPPVPLPSPDPALGQEPAASPAPALAPGPKAGPEPAPAPSPKLAPPPTPAPAPSPAPTPAPAPAPSPTPQPEPRPGPPPEPTKPSPPPLQPGTIPFLDASAGGWQFLIHLDGRPLGYAYIFPNPRSPFISLGAFNSLFGRNLYWAPLESGWIRIYASDRSFVTADYNLEGGRVWLKLTPSLQQHLGIQMQTFNESEFHFGTRH